MGIKKVFGENVRHYRKLKNLTQEKLAEMIDVSPKHLGVIERGEAFVSAELLEKLSSFLENLVSSLFYCETEAKGTDEFLKRVDEVIERELESVALKIKSEIRIF